MLPSLLTALATTLLLSAQPVLSALTPGTLPLLAYSSPKLFPGLEEGFTSLADNIFFLPPFHPCGTLLVISAPGVTYEDLENLPKEIDTGSGKGGRVGVEWEAAPSQVLENDAREEGVLAWAKGWKGSCGKGEAMREVKVAKIVVESLKNSEGGDRTASVLELDRQITVHLTSLPAPPHNRVVILSPLSPSALKDLFDIVATPSLPSEPSKDGNSGGKSPISSHPSRGFFGFIYSVIKFFVKVAVVGGIAYLGYQVWQRRQEKKRGAVNLADEEEFLDYDAE